MATTKKKSIHITVGEKLKEEADKLFNDPGLNMTTAITTFLKQSVTNQSSPFQISRGNKETLQVLKDIEAGNEHGGFDSIDSLLEDLDT
ncbi:type II toxin-antitoxin system RelB/DinJ family antitoxin [Enterococcus sp. AZ072]|uniref:type II toxin-antitoxin system RelB/DinJ family antitoxin n=1 Tax=unclassified Enterococcus TaxID=2608891 RepID=UPI003D2D80E2